MPKSSNFFIEFLRLARLFWHSEHKRRIRGATALLALLTVMQNTMAVLMTEWSAALFDALEEHSMSGLRTQVGMLVLLFITSMALTGSHLVVKRNLQIRWRTWMTDYVISRWMRDGRHYLISHLPGEHDNPDGRIAEDCRIVTDSAIEMGHSLFFSVLLIVSFTQLLWSLSGVVVLDLGFVQIPIYGHLVWIAIMYAATASALGWFVGRPLTAATNAKQTAEANFRAGLIDARENSQAIALIQAEGCERHRFHELFRQIRHVWDIQTAAWRNILMFGSGFSTMSMAFPILISAPRYIWGQITLGSLMQSVQAFQQLASALSWPVNNLAGIAEWRASVERILGLLKAMEDVEVEIAKPEHHWIVRKDSDRPVLALRDIRIAKFNGPVLAEGINIEIQRGEHVLITGNTFTGAKLFRAIAGIRPWGSGTIELPSDDRLFFMPPRPHLPHGTLRGAICYPSPCGVFTDAEVEDALRLVGLGHLIEQLDQVDKWTTTLARGEQQRLGVVRLLLNRPHWVFLQEALDSLEPEEEERMLRLICEHNPDATLITISHLPNGATLHSRRLVL